MKSKIKKVVNNILLTILRWINYLTPKNEKKIVARVDSIKGKDGKFTIVEEDNAYVLCEYIKKIDPSIEVEYINKDVYIGEPPIKEFIRNYNIFRKAAIVFIKNAPPRMYFCKKQRVITLGYFTPFKADKMLENMTDEKYGIGYQDGLMDVRKELRKLNYEYFTTSRYASIINSTAFNIDIRHFKELGMARNDLMFKKKDVDIKEVFGLDFQPKKIIMYAPTFKDYDNYLNKEDTAITLKSIIGYDNIKYDLTKLLKDNDCVIILKTHNCIEQKDLIDKDGKGILPDNVVLFSDEIKEKYNFGGYDLFPFTDAMIADYSSISFDYLNLDKPIIYNVYDMDIYIETRGLSMDPMEVLMPGEIVKTSKEFLNAINNVIIGEDNNKEKRSVVNKVVNKYSDDKNCERIYNYIFKK
ncbi:MAG: CDP-glycerol glycerophosphotransferase family protein [Clostridium sp.]